MRFFGVSLLRAIMNPIPNMNPMKWNIADFMAVISNMRMAGSMNTANVNIGSNIFFGMKLEPFMAVLPIIE